jgi:RNA polymerase sigma factor for flagellar operon FliA
MATHFATTATSYNRNHQGRRLRTLNSPLIKNVQESFCLSRGESSGEESKGDVKMTECNSHEADLLSLLQRVARKMRAHIPAHIELEDLVGAGSLGLVDALRKFDPRKRVKFESYAQYRIRGAILDSLRSMDGASRDMRKKIKSAEKVHQELEARLGRPASDQDMAQAQGITLKTWYRNVLDFQPLGVAWMQPMSSMAEPQPGAEDLPADVKDNQFDLCYRREKIDILNRALTSLSERERLIMKLYYSRERTMKQIGSQLKIDESRVSQLHSAALIRLRNAVKSLIQDPHPHPVASVFFSGLQP